MIRCYIISFFVYLLCSSIYASNQWSDFDANDIYPYIDTSNCVFPFTYRGQVYYNMTTDGDNGDLPWCSLTSDYQGLFTYCYDFRRSSLTCLPQFSVNGKTFTKCDYLSKTARYKQCKTSNPNYPYRYCIEEHVKPSGKPLRRMDTCDQNYKGLSNFHTMCYGPSDYAIPVQITDSEIQAILDIHNQYRGSVNAKYMFKLYWDNELAKVAQAHSNMCAFDHDLAVNRVTPKFGWKNGQNMVMSTEIRSPLAGLLDTMFSSELAHFQYGVGCYPESGSCLHYTQLMLSNMTRVGCAQTHCLYPDRIERFLTCNYIHSQYQDNYATPYELSNVAASGCPSKKSGTLCDCGDKFCDFNTQYLDPNTCNCKNLVTKRSIEKRDVNDDDDELKNNQKPFLAIPHGSNVDSHTPKKRSFNLVHQQSGSSEKNFRKRFNATGHRH